MTKTVLIIEDDEVILEFVRLILQQHDFTVLAVNNGQDGVAMARKYRPDLIVSDLHMAGGDGLYVLRIVRESPDTASIPFILVTANLSPEARQRCYAMGATQIFLKPFDPDVLVNAIGQILSYSENQNKRDFADYASGTER